MNIDDLTPKQIKEIQQLTFASKNDLMQSNYPVGKNAGLCVTYGKNAPYCTLPAKRVFATVNGEKLLTWCTKILMHNGKDFVDARY